MKSPLVFPGLHKLLCLLALCLVSVPAAAQGSAGPYVPTPWPIVDEMFKMADIKKDDYLIDIGSGDGRLVITAAKRFGARGLGIDIQAPLVKLATENAAKEKVSDRVEFVVGDIFETDLLSKATIITVYLLPSIMDKLVPKLQRDLKPGTRIVSHDYPLSGMVHDKVEEFNFKEKVEISGTTRTVLYHYVVPGPKAEAKPAAAAKK
jgi:ubiquinone/menaquinone biosynthesis C-methylase UbiE